MKRALLVVYRSSQFKEMHQAALALKYSNEYIPIMLWPWTDLIKKEEVVLCEKEGIPCLDIKGNELDAMEMSSEEHSRSASLKTAIDNIKSFSILIKLPIYLLKLMRYMQKIKHFYGKYRPDILVLPCDHLEYETALFTRIARINNIPSVILPFTTVSSDDIARGYSGIPDRAVGFGLNWLVSKIYPKWVQERNGKKILRLPSYKILAYEWLGLAPAKPWVFNSGLANTIVVESEHILNNYLQEGLPAANLVLAGSFAGDNLYYAMNNRAENIKKLYAKLRLQDGKKMILCSLPGDLFANRASETEFSSYKEMIEFIISKLSDLSDFNIVINLHPSLDPSQLVYLERSGKVAFSSETLSNLFPLCDIFVSNVSSSIKWAVACGRPVVQYDVYRYGYKNYEKALGVVTLSEKSKYIDVIERLSKDQDYLKQMADRQAGCMEEWGMLDGKSGQRILALFDKLITKTQPLWRQISIVIFCQASADVQYVLTLYERNKDRLPISIYVVNSMNIYKYLKSLDLKTHKLELITYNRSLNYKNVIELWRERIRIKKLYSDNFKDLKGAEVYFFSHYYDWITAVIIKKISIFNNAYYIDHYEIDENEERAHNLTIKERLLLIVYYYLSGLKYEFSKRANVKILTFPYKKYPILKLNMPIAKSILSKYVYKISNLDDNAILLYERNQNGKDLMPAYEKTLMLIVKDLISSGYSIYIKPHPVAGYSKFLGNLKLKFIPDYIPGELLDTSGFSAITGIESVVLAKIAKHLNRPVFSLIEMFEFRSTEMKGIIRDYLMRQSGDKLKYAKSVKDIIEEMRERNSLDNRLNQETLNHATL